MNRYFVTPYVIDRAETLKSGITTLTDAPPKVVDANNSIDAALANRPGKVAFWHVRKLS